MKAHPPIRKPYRHPAERRRLERMRQYLDALFGTDAELREQIELAQRKLRRL